MLIINTTQSGKSQNSFIQKLNACLSTTETDLALKSDEKGQKNTNKPCFRRFSRSYLLALCSRTEWSFLFDTEHQHSYDPY